MNWLQRLYGASVGKKVVMAGTGTLFFLFVIVHMLGNLQVYLGPEKFNAYAAFLQGTPALLWTARIILLTAVLLHLTAALQLWLQRHRARPILGHKGTRRIIRDVSRIRLGGDGEIDHHLRQRQLAFR